MQNAVSTYNYLKLIPFINFDLWDTKRYTSKSLTSTYNIVQLGYCIIEENKKYKLYEDEETEFGILGVNNKEGIFDAYLEKGKDINQAYKKMEVGWLAYNPYRINVGSIGIRLKEHKNEYISPAYVVFSCKENLLPEYLFLVFKTQIFNKVINESTTGSVRQNLTIDILKKLKIPLPTLTEQQQIVDAYSTKIQQAQALQTQANNLEEEIEKYFLEQLGIEKEQKAKKSSLLRFIEYIDFDRWDGKSEKEFSSIYNIERIGKYITEISTGTTPPTSREEYFNGEINFYAPSDLGKEMYLKEAERKVTDLAIKDKKARRFEKDTLLFVGIGSTVGKIGIVANEYATSNQQITGFKVDNASLLNEFVYYYFNLCKHITVKEQTKATIPIVNQDKIVNIQIPIPPINIQKRISDAIKSMQKKVVLNSLQSIKIKNDAQQEFEKQIFG